MNTTETFSTCHIEAANASTLPMPGLFPHGSSKVPSPLSREAHLTDDIWRARTKRKQPMRNLNRQKRKRSTILSSVKETSQLSGQEVRRQSLKKHRWNEPVYAINSYGTISELFGRRGKQIVSDFNWISEWVRVACNRCFNIKVRRHRRNLECLRLNSDHFREKDRHRVHSERFVKLLMQRL